VKITQLSWADISGGAALAAYRLHKGLQQLGHESRMLVQYKNSEEPAVLNVAPPLDVSTRIRRIFRRNFLKQSRKFHYSHRPANHSYFSDDRSEHSADVLRQAIPTDILHLHWIAGFIDYLDFFPEIPHGPPVVWTMHDMNPFTGGCHYAGDCGRFKHTCGACPQLGSSIPKDFSNAIWQRKRLAYTNLKSGRFCVVAPSRWLANQAQQSGLLNNFPIQVIPYGLDTEHFQPRDRNMSRQVLGIPPNANVLLFVSGMLDDGRKGLPQLIEALSRIRWFPNLLLLIIGDGKLAGELPVPSLSFGFLRQEGILSLAYSAADLFVLPSLEDNLPNTALESLACGLPVAGFDVGGIPDIVRTAVTGVLVERANSEALATAIENLLNDPELLKKLSSNCRHVAVEEYRLDVQARRYVELYSSLLG
jgi:glycosyltransferase involved in cell wall biosynthesis